MMCTADEARPICGEHRKLPGLVRLGKPCKTGHRFH
jgi:hypothetical protein